MENRYIVKFINSDTMKLDSLLRGKFKASFPSEFNDPLDSEFHLNGKEIKKLSIKYGLNEDSLRSLLLYASSFQMVCLSDCDPLSFDSTLMWAHYANSFNGVAVCYNRNDFLNAVKSKDVTGDLKQDITYVLNHNNRFNVFDDIVNLAFVDDLIGKTNNINKINKLLIHEYSRKLKFWSYENEIRLFYSGFNNLMIHSANKSIEMAGLTSPDNDVLLDVLGRLILKERSRKFIDLINDQSYNNRLFLELLIKPEKVILGHKVDNIDEVKISKLCTNNDITVTRLTTPSSNNECFNEYPFK